MMQIPPLKIVVVAVASLGFAAGCAQQQTQPEPQPAPAPVAPKGPSEAEKAIADAKAAISKAKSLDWIWRDTEKFLKKAEAALAKGDEAKAIKLANKAKLQADLAVEQYYLERSVDRSLPPLKGVTSYTVVRGDSLWRIAGKDEIYGDPYEWPLIYKANADQIEDADLIYPGQEFQIDIAPSADEVEAAIRHARTRGAWSLGVVEESDRAYLGR